MLAEISIKRANPFAFFVSVLIHGIVGMAAVLMPPVVSNERPSTVADRKYTVLLLRVDRMPQKSVAPSAQPVSMSARNVTASKAGGTYSSPDASQDQPHVTHDSREFILPPIQRPQTARQTIVQADVPPDIRVIQEIPLPMAVMWERMPAFRKPFVAPPHADQARTAKEPLLVSPPSDAPLISDLQLAATAPPPLPPKLFRPPSRTIPLRGDAVQDVAAPPQISRPDLRDSGLSALISLPRDAITSSTPVAILPANQIGADLRSGSRGSGNIEAGSNIKGLGPSGRAADNQLALSGARTDNASLGKAGNGSNGSSLSTTALPDPLPGTTLITLPKDGQFGVVVSGSSLAAPYTEGVGILSGKAVYSVYLNVGLRKKWILQYSLPKREEEERTQTGLAAPRVEAPWPYYMIRPDDLGGPDSDYLVVRGLLSEEGRFDRLALVFPAEVAKKNLLMNSLREWSFRPASRDGVVCEVEILLIIPTRSE